MMPQYRLSWHTVITHKKTRYLRPELFRRTPASELEWRARLACVHFWSDPQAYSRSEYPSFFARLWVDPPSHWRNLEGPRLRNQVVFGGKYNFLATGPDFRTFGDELEWSDPHHPTTEMHEEDTLIVAVRRQRVVAWSSAFFWIVSHTD
jgi:hypothetical protein